MKNFELIRRGGLKTIAISKLAAHPDNPNVMSGEKFRKLVRNIERTGYIEPIVVRPHPKKKGHFQIINGFHRVKAIEKLGRSVADCVVWDVDDEQTSVLLATLNRLCGSDVPGKKIELLKQLKERMGAVGLAKLLPQTAKQIEQLTNLKLSAVPIRPAGEIFAIPLVFFVNQQQKDVIEKAIAVAEGDCFGLRPRNDKTTKAQQRAAAVAKIAEQFLRTSGVD